GNGRSLGGDIGQGLNGIVGDGIDRGQRESAARHVSAAFQRIQEPLECPGRGIAHAFCLNGDAHDVLRRREGRAGWESYAEFHQTFPLLMGFWGLRAVICAASALSVASLYAISSGNRQTVME